ncbi:PHP domain-containing protein [Ornithinimicrobium avium]|uniref:PHP domain-containing protein n=1 Tax=Ornithinimicrobium avium TaxID=2283195 RepID=A0A345NRJ3_9MICO|nr:PHP domain-containing protein [Ornithinimicrobium avium]AXH97651.1 PHP domain-containing protein [Ornithinimicrobium avium]
MAFPDPDAVVDLHTHSCHSDGTEPPGTVVRRAAAAGLDVVALTDHDVATGWDEADRAGREAGVVVVPGIEVSCSWRGISVHLLAYLPDPTDQALAGELAASRLSRDTRMRAMVERVAADGYPVSYEELVALAGEGATLGRPHLADLLVSRGVVPDRDAAFVDILSSRSRYYVAHAAPDPVRATELVVGAGGVAVMAHPFAGGRGRTVDDDVVARMAQAGLAGLEVDHRDHEPDERAHAADLATRLGLLRTGASDYHGAGKPNRLGENTTSPAVLGQILSRASGTALLGAAPR